MSTNDNVHYLPIRPRVSNIGTVANHLLKYLVALSLSLSKCKYLVKSSKSFVEKPKVAKVPSN